MSSGVSIAGRAKWLENRALQKLLGVLSADGEGARIVGGAIRNTLFGEAAGDIDIATTIVPDVTIARSRAAGFKAIPTGYEHGTVTVVAGSCAYEVTTLRADVATDGRRASVKFGRDWKADAERRDFTINALYADAAGTVFDPVAGLNDIETRTLRFIGDPEKRIREDYLRILRFFRFFAFYGSGRPETEGLKACARLKDGIDKLSAERIWSELKKLLSAPDCARALLWMRQTGVLTKVLPESEKWGIDAIPGLMAAEREFQWPPDPLLRLEAMVRPHADAMERLADRLRLSRSEKLRLEAWSKAPALDLDTDRLSKVLYGAGQEAGVDALRLKLASAFSVGESDDTLEQAKQRLAFAENWQRPKFPLRGRDVVALGVEDGPAVGDLLRALEAEWIDSGFTLARDELMNRAKQATDG